MARSPLQNVPSTPLLMTHNNNNNNSPSAVVPQSNSNTDPWRSPEASTSGRNIRTPVESPEILAPNLQDSSQNDKSEAPVVSLESSTSDQQVPGTPVQSSKTNLQVQSSNRQKVHQRRCAAAKNQELSEDSLAEVPDIPSFNLFCGEEIFI